jgi:hypothetical protein
MLFTTVLPALTVTPDSSTSSVMNRGDTEPGVGVHPQAYA